HTTAPLSSRFPESFLHTLSCNRPKNRVHWRRWTRTSSFSVDLRFDQGIVASVPFLKRGEKICAPLRRSSLDIARNCGCLRSALPKCFYLRFVAAAFAWPEIPDERGRRAPLHNNCD